MPYHTMKINKIYVLTTPWNGHRLYTVLKDLYLHFDNTDIQIVYGVDKHTIKIEDEKWYTDGNHFWEVTEMKLLRTPEDRWIGHLACNMSHTNIIHDALHKWYENIIVVEDDLMMWRRSRWTLEKALEHLPKDWELLRLSRFPSPGINVKEYNEYRYTGNGIRWSELYLINKAGIKKLYDNLIAGSRASYDYQLHQFTEINQYILKYSLWIQWNNYDNDMNISEKNWSYAISESWKWWYTISKHKKSPLLSPKK